MGSPAQLVATKEFLALRTVTKTGEEFAPLYEAVMSCVSSTDMGIGEYATPLPSMGTGLPTGMPSSANDTSPVVAPATYAPTTIGSPETIAFDSGDTITGASGDAVYFSSPVRAGEVPSQCCSKVILSEMI